MPAWNSNNGVAETSEIGVHSGPTRGGLRIAPDHPAEVARQVLSFALDPRSARWDALGTRGRHRKPLLPISPRSFLLACVLTRAQDIYCDRNRRFFIRIAKNE